MVSFGRVLRAATFAGLPGRPPRWLTPVLTYIIVIRIDCMILIILLCILQRATVEKAKQL
jgi:hypothetical protein